MKNIRIVSDCLVNREHTPAGSKLENVDSHVAADLIATGRAVEIPAKPEVLTHRDPKPANRDPKPAKNVAKDAPVE